MPANGELEGLVRNVWLEIEATIWPGPSRLSSGAPPAGPEQGAAPRLVALTRSNLSPVPGQELAGVPKSAAGLETQSIGRAR
jgi:hypothetical protein